MEFLKRRTETIVAQPYEYDVKSTLNLKLWRHNVFFICRFAIFERLLLKMNDYFWFLINFLLKNAKKPSRNALVTV